MGKKMSEDPKHYPDNSEDKRERSPVERGVRQASPFEIALQLPSGKAIEVPIESISGQIKRDLFTGLDLMGPLRREDIDKWRDMVSDNWGISITINIMQGILTFYKPA